jgi:L-lactate dehydrogenase complex protein LldE
MKIQLFITCLIDSFFPEIGLDVLDVLRLAGVSVEFLEKQTCCGQPAFNAGYWDDAKAIAKKFLDDYNHTTEPIIVPSGSCAAMVRKGYLKLFAEDPVYLQPARSCSERTYELTEFLSNNLNWTHFPATYSHRTAYHPSCHLLREIHIDQQPVSLLEGNGVDVTKIEPECCGFGGVFAVDQSEISAAMLERKINQIESSQPDGVIACDVSCLMHIEGGLRKKGSAIRCAHIAQILNGKPYGLR